MCLVCHPSLHRLSRLSLNQKFSWHLKMKSFHPCCTYVTAHFLSHGDGCYCFSLSFFFFFFQGLICRAVFAQVLSQCMRVTQSERTGWACEKWMPSWMHERRRVRVMCHCVCVWGGRPENVDLTPRAPAVFIPYSAEFNIEGLGAVKTYQSHDAYSWYNVLGRGTFFHVERCCGGNNITHAGWMSGKIRGVLLSNRTDGHFLFYHLVPVFFFFCFFPHFFLFQWYTASQFPVNRKWWPNFFEWAVCRKIEGNISRFFCFKSIFSVVVLHWVYDGFLSMTVSLIGFSFSCCITFQFYAAKTVPA